MSQTTPMTALELVSWMAGPAFLILVLLTG